MVNQSINQSISQSATAQLMYSSLHLSA